MPEFFAFLGVDIFVALSLLSCLLDDHLPKTLPYIFQAAAIGGYVHILISKQFLPVFGEYMRFWYCVLYLSVALANVIAVNMYLAIVKKRWTLAKFFSATAVFPSFFVSFFFLSNYSVQIGFSLLDLAMPFSMLALGLTISVLVSPETIRKHLRGGERK